MGRQHLLKHTQTIMKTLLVIFSLIFLQQQCSKDVPDVITYPENTDTIYVDRIIHDTVEVDKIIIDSVPYPVIEYVDVVKPVAVHEVDTTALVKVIASFKDELNGDNIVVLFRNGDSFTVQTDSLSLDGFTRGDQAYLNLKVKYHQYGDSLYAIKLDRLWPDPIRVKVNPVAEQITSTSLKYRFRLTKNNQITSIRYKQYGTRDDWHEFQTPLGFSASKLAWDDWRHSRVIDRLKPDTRYIISVEVESIDGELYTVPSTIHLTLP